ncbi:MAG: NFACT family protein, partial [Armatimonadota bacterium]
MLFDSLMLAVAAREIEDACQRDRVRRVLQPNYTDIYLVFRRGAIVCISAAPELCRVHLASEVPEAAIEPTPFCQALRKHLEGAVLVRAEQLRFDRVLFLHFSNCGGFGPEATAALVAEPTGRLANMMLLDTTAEPDPEIIACAKHVTRRVNRYREVLPGEPYVPPPVGNRFNPRGLPQSQLQSRLGASEGDIPLEGFLRKAFEGASSVFVAEVVCRAGLDPDASAHSLDDESLARLHENLTRLAGLEVETSPAIYQTEIRRPFAYPVELQHLAGEADVRPMPSLSAAMEEAARQAVE